MEKKEQKQKERNLNIKNINIIIIKHKYIWFTIYMNHLDAFIFILFLIYTSAFINFRQGSQFHIKNREIKKQITYNNTNTIINQISGFYGLIGPDIDKFSIKTIYDLFTGDGIIQGVFFDRGNITFVKHFVRTEKILYEEKYGKFSKNILMTPFFIFMNKIGMLPNVLGLANTAILKIENNILALFERDLPYDININFENKQISTIKKINIPGISHFSGHSKYNEITNTIHTIDYDIIRNVINYFILDNEFKITKMISLRTMYIPIIHDFTVLEKGMLFIDSPIVWNFLLKIPVSLADKKPTFIHIYNETLKTRTQYECEESFYIFHYADVIENENKNTIEIYGSLYDKLDFSSLNIQGKYRKIIINLLNGEVLIKKNIEFENMNLDFPLKWKEYIILRSISNQSINGFVVCKELELIKKIILPENRYFCGEPSIIEISGSPFLIGFSYDLLENSFLLIIGIFSETYIEIPLNKDIQLTIGFHSIFLNCMNDKVKNSYLLGGFSPDFDNSA